MNQNYLNMNIIKKYIYPRREQCPTCKTGSLIEMFYLKKHPYQGDIRIGRTNPGPTYSLETEGTSCNSPACRQRFNRLDLDEKTLNDITSILMRNIYLVSEDILEIFPEDQLNKIIPKTLPEEFPDSEKLEVLSKALGRKSSNKTITINTRTFINSLDDDTKKFDFAPDPKLRILFELLSPEEQARIEQKFETLKQELLNYEQRILNENKKRIETLRTMAPKTIRKGTRVEILDDSEWSGSCQIFSGTYDHSKYTPVNSLSNDLEGIHYLPKGSVIAESDELMLDMKEFWPENIAFEKASI